MVTEDVCIMRGNKQRVGAWIFTHIKGVVVGVFAYLKYT